MHKPKVIAIVGPTASGKTSLSITLAQECSGEIISADSRQVYQGLDIGSGKVTHEEMAGIPHHLLDMVSPMTVYTGINFVHDAGQAIVDIHNRKHTPVVVGGTFFYLDLLRGKIQAAPVLPNQAFRDSLADLSNTALLEKLYVKDKDRAEKIDKHNRRRLIRALEITEALGKVPKQIETKTPYEWLLIGIDIDKTQLHQNISTRLKERLEQGMIKEAETLHQAGLTYERMDTLGLEYRYLAKYLQGILTKEEFIEQLEHKIKQFAKRQMTWLKRDKEIEWFKPADQPAIIARSKEFLTDNYR